MLAVKLLKDNTWLSLKSVCNDSELREPIAVPYNNVTFTVSFIVPTVTVADVELTLVDTLELFGPLGAALSETFNCKTPVRSFPFESIAKKVML